MQARRRQTAMCQRQVILQFFYAGCRVKSIDVAALPKPACALIAAAVLCLGGFAFGQKPLAIVEQVLPALDAGVEVRIPLHVTGGIPPYQWRVVAGDLPQGISLTTDGVLFGRPTKPGAVAVT